MKKKLLLITILFVSFFLVGCEKEEEPIHVNPTIVEEKQWHSDNEKLVFDMDNVMHLFYFDSSKKITNHVVYLKYGTVKDATENIKTYENHYQEVKQEENYLILTYKKEEYENETVNSIREKYSLYEVTE